MWVNLMLVNKMSSLDLQLKVPLRDSCQRPCILSGTLGAVSITLQSTQAQLEGSEGGSSQPLSPKQQAEEELKKTISFKTEENQETSSCVFQHWLSLEARKPMHVLSKQTSKGYLKLQSFKKRGTHVGPSEKQVLWVVKTQLSGLASHSHSFLSSGQELLWSGNPPGDTGLPVL